jgi:hypothetical protein
MEKKSTKVFFLFITSASGTAENVFIRIKDRFSCRATHLANKNNGVPL